MNFFERLPHELNHIIGSYLDLESRISFNRCLVFEDRQSFRFNHNSLLMFHFNITLALLKDMVNAHEKTIGLLPRLFKLHSIYKKMGYSKDGIFDILPGKLCAAVLKNIQKCRIELQTYRSRKKRLPYQKTERIFQKIETRFQTTLGKLLRNDRSHVLKDGQNTYVAHIISDHQKNQFEYKEKK